MCDVLAIGVKTAVNDFCDFMETPLSSIAESYDYLGREVQYFVSDLFSPQIGQIARRIFNALPVTVTLLLIPKNVSAGIVTGLLVIGFIAPALDTLIGKEMRQRVYRGVSDALFINAGSSLVTLAITGSTVHLGHAIGSIFTSVLAYIYSEAN